MNYYMKLLVIFSLEAVSSCATKYPIVYSHEKNIHTIRYPTGKYGTNWYDGAFLEKANESCPKGYKILEKTKEPSTNEKVDDWDYFWIIQCNPLS